MTFLNRLGRAIFGLQIQKQKRLQNIPLTSKRTRYLIQCRKKRTNCRTNLNRKNNGKGTGNIYLLGLRNRGGHQKTAQNRNTSLRNSTNYAFYSIQENLTESFNTKPVYIRGLDMAVMHRMACPNLATAVSGDGMFVIDRYGNRYLDACGGAAVSCLGHSNDRVKQAIIDQISAIPYVHSFFFTNESQELLAKELIDNSSGNYSQVYFVSSGSEAVEASLKLARQYFLEQGKDTKKLFISRRQSYHGNTLGALAISGNMKRRKPFDPILVKGNYISTPYEYRNKQKHETSFEYGQRLANELETKINKLGAENVAAFIAETVGGATTGALTAPEGYFPRIREICNQYDILLILDEIMCGMGRTGSLHACEQEAMHGDLQTIAKGLASGYQALGAVLVDKNIVDVIECGSGYFQHGHTFTGHPTGCAAGLATQLEIREKNLLNNVKDQGIYLVEALKEKVTRVPELQQYIGDIRGRGLLIGVELVKDTKTKVPFDPKFNLHNKIRKHALKNYLMIYPKGGTIDGINGDHILLAPPFIVEEDHINQIIERLSNSILDATAA